jgi:hypothetical protein
MYVQGDAGTLKAAPCADTQHRNSNLRIQAGPQISLRAIFVQTLINTFQWTSTSIGPPLAK